jgi:hypothetical protein
MAFNDPPKGKCDMCRTKPARYWFGDTSVALCGDEDCSRRNQENWNRMLEEMEQDDE